MSLRDVAHATSWIAGVRFIMRREYGGLAGDVTDLIKKWPIDKARRFLRHGLMVCQPPSNWMRWGKDVGTWCLKNGVVPPVTLGDLERVQQAMGLDSPTGLPGQAPDAIPQADDEPAATKPHQHGKRGRGKVVAALALVISMLAGGDLHANPVASSPLSSGAGTCVKKITGGAAAVTVASLCGITDQNVGASGFSLAVHSTTLTVCLGGSDVTTVTSAPSDGGVLDGGAPTGRCWAVCDTTVGTHCVGKVQPVRGNIHKWYVKAATSVTVSVIYGTGYP
jgi:hypothetical protein